MEHLQIIDENFIEIKRKSVNTLDQKLDILNENEENLKRWVSYINFLRIFSKITSQISKI